MIQAKLNKDEPLDSNNQNALQNGISMPFKYYIDFEDKNTPLKQNGISKLEYLKVLVENYKEI